MTRLSRRAGTMIPTASQHHLLRAALLEAREGVRSAFEAWCALVDLDDADLASLRLFPLVYQNLKRFGVEHEHLPRLRGIYRQTWVRNQLLIERSTPVLSLLHAASIETMLLKGSAMVSAPPPEMSSRGERGVYEDAALRPMDDFDVLVRRRDFRRATEVLVESGWRLHDEITDRDAYFEFRHAACLLDSNGREIDLHWSTLADFADVAREEELWRAAPPASIGGVDTRVLAPEDQLLQIIGHATFTNRTVAPIRWAADATMLLRARRDSFDWARLVDCAKRAGLSVVASTALEYLRDGLGAGVPERVTTALRCDASPLRSLRLRLRMIGGRPAYIDDIVTWSGRAATGPIANVPRRVSLLFRFARSLARGVPFHRFVLSRLLHGRGVDQLRASAREHSRGAAENHRISHTSYSSGGTLPKA